MEFKASSGQQTYGGERKMWQPDYHPSRSLLVAGGGAILFLLVAVAALRAETTAPPETATITNRQLRISVDAHDGHLREFRDLLAAHNHIADQADGLWEIRLLIGSAPLVLSPTQALSFRAEALARDPQKLRLIWSEFGLAQSPTLRVEVEVQLAADDPSSKWHLRIENLGPLRPDAIRFPRVTGLVKQAQERLAVPVWQGQLATDPRRLLNPPGGKPRRLEWEYPGILSLQTLAFYREAGPGFYLACDDVKAQRKSFAIFGRAPDELGFEIVHVPERDRTAHGRFELPYRIVLGTFVGDWFTAAERYRQWATNQKWARQSRLRRGLVPDWVTQTGMWVWNRGRSPGVLTPAVELQQQTGLPVSVLWHWWHGCSYDTGFPEYLPPREGEESFRTALAAAHKHDVHALVYMNQRLWGMTTASWTNAQAERFAVKNAAGKIHPEIYNTFTKAPCVAMCMGTEFWRKTYASLAEQAVRDLGVDGIYMDQACASLACYDPTHGHPAGGGSYWMQGFRDLAADIRERAAVGPARSRRGFVAPKLMETKPVGPTPALAGEGCGEPWLPYLDLMLSLQISRERYSAPDGWETIPFFNAVYHDCVVTFGNYSSLTMPPYDDLWPAEFAPPEPLKLLDQKFSQHFYLEQLRAFVWGQQPTVANFLPAHLQQRVKETEYAIRLAKLRSRFPNFLLHGTMLRPPPIEVAAATIPMSRLSIYAGQQGGLKTFEKQVPLALAGAWRSPKGEVAVVLGSLADEPLELSLALDTEEYDLPKRGWIYRTDLERRERVGEFSQSATPLQIALPARGACVLEFRPRPER